MTTIALDDDVKGCLDDLKVHENESYNDVVARLVDEEPAPNEAIEELKNELSMVADPTVNPDVDGMMEKVSDLEREMKKCQELAEQARDEAQQVREGMGR